MIRTWEYTGYGTDVLALHTERFVRSADACDYAALIALNALRVLHPPPLLPCPFCGGDHIRYNDERQCYFCHRCLAEGPAELREFNWNRRAR